MQARRASTQLPRLHRARSHQSISRSPETAALRRLPSRCLRWKRPDRNDRRGRPSGALPLVEMQAKVSRLIDHHHVDRFCGKNSTEFAVHERTHHIDAPFAAPQWAGHRIGGEDDNGSFRPGSVALSFAYGGRSILVGLEVSRAAAVTPGGSDSATTSNRAAIIFFAIEHYPDRFGVAWRRDSSDPYRYVPGRREVSAAGLAPGTGSRDPQDRPWRRGLQLCTHRVPQRHYCFRLASISQSSAAGATAGENVGCNLLARSVQKPDDWVEKRRRRRRSFNLDRDIGGAVNMESRTVRFSGLKARPSTCRAA